MKVAKVMSRCESPLYSWVLSVTTTLLYTLNHSGWWSILSAFNATLVMNPKASLKSANFSSFLIASLPSTISQPEARRGASFSSRSSPSLARLLVGEEAYVNKTTRNIYYHILTLSLVQLDQGQVKQSGYRKLHQVHHMQSTLTQGVSPVQHCTVWIWGMIEMRK